MLKASFMEIEEATKPYRFKHLTAFRFYTKVKLVTGKVTELRFMEWFLRVLESFWNLFWNLSGIFFGTVWLLPLFTTVQCKPRAFS
jgi:hypothetical protein